MTSVAPDTMATRHDNGFDLLRLLGAIFVLYGHAWPLSGQPAPGFLGNHIQTIGVKIFFVISGYLIAKSWLSEPNIGRFAYKRFLRIFPGFAANIAFVAVVIGGVVTTMGLADYLGSAGFSRYFRNLLFYPIYDLPGVFVSNVYPTAVNGSLWSLPVEILMYLTVPALFFAGRDASAMLAIFVALIFCAAGLDYARIHVPDQPTVVYGTNLLSAVDVACYFQIGALYTYIDQRRLRRPVFALSVLALCAKTIDHYVLGEIVLMLLLPYCVIACGTLRLPGIARATRGIDLSYGLYLYGFPVQQLLMHAWPQLDAPRQFAAALPVTLALAAVSWFVVERPALRLKSGTFSYTLREQ